MSKETDPRMHTAEHILNQTMIRLFGCGRCFSAHIEKKKSKCDYHFKQGISPEEAKQIEDKVNEIINVNLPVREELVSREEADRKFNLERLPEGTTGDIRVIKIGDYDACPCVGPHVASTQELIGFRLVSANFENCVLRIIYKLTRE